MTRSAYAYVYVPFNRLPCKPYNHIIHTHVAEFLKQKRGMHFANKQALASWLVQFGSAAIPSVFFPSIVDHEFTQWSTDELFQLIYVLFVSRKQCKTKIFGWFDALKEPGDFKEWFVVWDITILLHALLEVMFYFLHTEQMSIMQRDLADFRRLADSIDTLRRNLNSFQDTQQKCRFLALSKMLRCCSEHLFAVTSGSCSKCHWFCSCGEERNFFGASYCNSALKLSAVEQERQQQEEQEEEPEEAVFVSEIGFDLERFVVSVVEE